MQWMSEETASTMDTEVFCNLGLGVGGSELGASTRSLS